VLLQYSVSFVKYFTFLLLHVRTLSNFSCEHVFVCDVRNNFVLCFCCAIDDARALYCLNYRWLTPTMRSFSLYVPTNKRRLHIFQFKRWSSYYFFKYCTRGYVQQNQINIITLHNHQINIITLHNHGLFMPSFLCTTKKVSNARRNARGVN
jgi:hypothetical protein